MGFDTLFLAGGKIVLRFSGPVYVYVYACLLGDDNGEVLFLLGRLRFLYVSLGYVRLLLEGTPFPEHVRSILCLMVEKCNM